MEIEITPEPSAEERAAIEAAVAALFDAEEPLRSVWWDAGVSGDDEDGYDVAGPRSSRGAARA